VPAACERLKKSTRPRIVDSRIASAHVAGVGPRACALALCTTLILIARDAGAGPRVVIVETRDAPALPALAAQVQLHAGQAVSISTIRDPSEGSATFAARASQVVDEQDAAIVVWMAAVESEDASRRTFLVYAAGRWPGRALIELVRLDARTPPEEIERTIALKIGELVDAARAPRPLGAALGVPVDRSRPARWRLDLVGALVREAGDRRFDGRLAAVVDRCWSLRGWIVAAGIGPYWQPSSAIEAEAGRVALREVGLGLSVAGERRVGAGLVFVRPRASATLLLVDGTSTGGERGSADVFSPFLGIDMGARWLLSDTLQLVVAGGIEAALIQQRFLLDGRVAADLRRTRVALALGLSIWLR
jgi:hypothetical protein